MGFSVNAAQVNVISNTNGGQTDNIAESNTQSSVFSSTTLLSLRERSIKDAIENQCFQQNMTFNELSLTDIRIRAVDWLLYYDPMMLNASSGDLFQRYALAVLMFPTRSDMVYFDRDECHWKGISCDESPDFGEFFLSSASNYPLPLLNVF